jgi:hypothetical protein
MDAYPKASKRLRDMTAAGVHLLPPPDPDPAIRELIPQLANEASPCVVQGGSDSRGYRS